MDQSHKRIMRVRLKYQRSMILFKLLIIENNENTEKAAIKRQSRFGSKNGSPIRIKAKDKSIEKNIGKQSTSEPLNFGNADGTTEDKKEETEEEVAKVSRCFVPHNPSRNQLLNSTSS